MPFRAIMRESETYARMIQPYPYAHSRAILREALIREDLHIAGGFAGAKVTYSVPHDKQ